jgi:hypothetical protein
MRLSHVPASIYMRLLPRVLSSAAACSSQHNTLLQTPNSTVLVHQGNCNCVMHTFSCMHCLVACIPLG